MSFLEAKFTREFDAGEQMQIQLAYDQIVGLPPQTTGSIIGVIVDSLGIDAAWTMSRWSLAAAALRAGLANTAILAAWEHVKAGGESRPIDLSEIVTLTGSPQVTVRTDAPPDDLPEPAKVAWHANNRAIRMMLREAKPAPANPHAAAQLPAASSDYAASAPVVPLIVAATCLGACAIWGVTSFATESKKSEVSLEESTRVLAHKANVYAQQVAAQLAAGQEITPPTPEVAELARQEATTIPWLGYGLAAAAGALVVGGIVARPPLLGLADRPTARPRRRNPSSPRKRTTSKRKAAAKKAAATRKRNAAKRKAAAKKAAATRRKKAAAKKKATPKRKTNPKRKAAAKKAAATRKRTTSKRKAAAKKAAATRKRNASKRKASAKKAAATRRKKAAAKKKATPKRKANPKRKRSTSKRKAAAKRTRRTSTTKRGKRSSRWG